MWMFVLLIVGLILGVYGLLTANYGYWKKRGVPHPPISIFFGNLKDSIFMKKCMGVLYQDVYKAYSGLSYVGFYKIRQPAIVVRDPELLKNILIKEFSSFHDNDMPVDPKVDPIFAKNPFVLKGDRWKVVRNQLIPNFTSKRMKSVFPLIEEVGNKLVTYLNNLIETSENEELEGKELAAKFTTDVVASCAFGLEGKAFEDPKSEFREIGRKFLTPSLILALKHMSVMFLPSLANILNLKFFPDEVANYFRNIVHQTIKYREDNNIVRGDFLDLMKELKVKLGSEEFDDEDIVAHAAGFYADGFETSSITLGFALFELAANPDVQTKLREEVDAALTKNNGRLSYEYVQEESYLNNVVFEALRKNPPAPFLAKLCTKAFTLPSPSSKGPDVTIDEGTSIIIPVLGIQHDPKFYPDPEKFDPSRFTEENLKSRPSCTFLSFGDGPRICLGQRFGLTQIKIALAIIVSKFVVRLNKKTTVPLEIDPQYFLLKAKGGIWLNFYKR